jgi:hypothetical protein
VVACFFLERYKENQMKIFNYGDIVIYKGPNVMYLKTSDKVRVLDKKTRDGYYWCSNMNSPFSGSFSGLLHKKDLDYK